MRLQSTVSSAFYDRALAQSNGNYEGVAVGPHALTQRATVTPPANQLYALTQASLVIYRATAPAPAGKAYITLQMVGAQLSPLLVAVLNSATVGAVAVADVGLGLVNPFGATLQLLTADASIGGTMDYHAGFFGVFFG